MEMSGDNTTLGPTFPTTSNITDVSMSLLVGVVLSTGGGQSLEEVRPKFVLQIIYFNSSFFVWKCEILLGQDNFLYLGICWTACEMQRNLVELRARTGQSSQAFRKLFHISGVGAANANRHRKLHRWLSNDSDNIFWANNGVHCGF